MSLYVIMKDQDMIAIVTRRGIVMKSHYIPKGRDGRAYHYEERTIIYDNNRYKYLRWSNEKYSEEYLESNKRTYEYICNPRHVRQHQE